MLGTRHDKILKLAHFVRSWSLGTKIRSSWTHPHQNWNWTLLDRFTRTCRQVVSYQFDTFFTKKCPPEAYDRITSTTLHGRNFRKTKSFCNWMHTNLLPKLCVAPATFYFFKMARGNFLFHTPALSYAPEAQEPATFLAQESPKITPETLHRRPWHPRQA